MNVTRKRLSGRRGAAPGLLGTYLVEIGRTPLLTADEERQLARRVRAGDREARDHLVRANLRLVVSIARGYARRGLDLEDLVGAGNLGLMRAVGRFDPAMNTRFSTYASYWVRQSIRKALVNTAKAIRIPAYMAGLLAKWRRAAAQLRQELKRPPAEEEVALRMGLSKEKLAVIKKALRVRNALTRRRSEEASAEELVQGGRAEVPDVTPAEADELRRALDLLERLAGQQAVVLRMRFGLGDEGPRTLKEVGERLGFTKERARQVERAALAGLRGALECERRAGHPGRCHVR
jgi:RNA polymerase primary sigma factor